MEKYSFNEKEHIHTLDGVPLVGTTTALSVITKPLTWWASGLACTEFGWSNPRTTSADVCFEKAREMLDKIKSMSTLSYQQLLNRAYRAHSVKLTKSADAGIDRHTLIENYINSDIEKKPMLIIDDSIKPFVEWSKKNVRRFLFSELHCYSRPLWVGGIADFGYEDMNGNYVLCDLKSSREAYFSQWVQLAGYQMQIEENGGYAANGEKIFKADRPFVSNAIFCFGYDLGKQFFNHEGLRCKCAFSYAVNLYKERMLFEKEFKLINRMA